MEFNKLIEEKSNESLNLYSNLSIDLYLFHDAVLKVLLLFMLIWRYALKWFAF
jgi:hypothetical protein